MAAYLFSWNPKNWPFDERLEKIEEIRITGSTRQRWSVAAYKQVRPGDRAFIVKVGKKLGNQGIFGSGTIVSWPFLAPHWQNDEILVERVMIEFDSLLDPETQNILPLKIIKKEIINYQAWTPQHSGININIDVIDKLETLWSNFLGDRTPMTQRPLHLPLYPEGNPYQLILSRYERDPNAREACLQYHGYDCSVCTLNFEDIYGKSYIHVHHKEELSLKNRQTNPITDLCPVCPNCHAMLHSQRPAMTVDELKEIIKNIGNWPFFGNAV